jgi:GNAT superfamily N-acetyltransferase
MDDDLEQPEAVEEPEIPGLQNTLLELAEEPGLWLPAEPKLAIFRAESFAFVTYGRAAWVHRLRLGEDEVEAAVERVEGMIELKGLKEATWWVGELSTPEDLGERLLALGLEPDSPPDMVTLTIAEPPAGGATVEVRRVETFEDYLTALEIDWASFDVPEEERATRRLEAEKAWPRLQASDTQSTYLASVDGNPVGFGRAIFTRTAALLLGGATLPEARGRGVYTSLVHARWDEAVARGIPRITVSAGPLSAPILERLGFAPIGNVHLFRQPL